MTSYIATMNDAAKTDIQVTPRAREIEAYGLVQAILEEARRTPAYKALRQAEDAQIISIEIDGEVITQF
ncbi:hypothetical protein [Sphingomonas pituitosa]|uniref:hypothetical protein n=1 Tax=Sphingomonas pituitosa TaxID=99597 RepID=UPI00083002C4|nr:hypothetical protein [Sphingomonas pituitosa]